MKPLGALDALTRERCRALDAQALEEQARPSYYHPMSVEEALLLGENAGDGAAARPEYTKDIRLAVSPRWASPRLRLVKKGTHRNSQRRKNHRIDLGQWKKNSWAWQEETA